jgi:hypothetical protein
MIPWRAFCANLGPRFVYGWSCSCACDDMPPTLPRPEVLIGRSLALCVHPQAAWRSQSAAGRWLLALAYAITGYAIVLSALFSLSR